MDNLTAVFGLISAAHTLSAATAGYLNDPTTAEQLTTAYADVIEARKALLQLCKGSRRPEGYQFAIDYAGGVLNEADDAYRAQTGEYLPVCDNG